MREPKTHCPSKRSRSSTRVGNSEGAERIESQTSQIKSQNTHLSEEDRRPSFETSREKRAAVERADRETTRAGVVLKSVHVSKGQDKHTRSGRCTADPGASSLSTQLHTASQPLQGAGPNPDRHAKPKNKPRSQSGASSAVAMLGNNECGTSGDGECP